MRTDSDAVPDPRSIRTLIDQLALLTEELDGQLRMISRLPDSFMRDRPFEGVLSVWDLYLQFLRREEETNLNVVKKLADGTAEGMALDSVKEEFNANALREATVGEIISRIARVRGDIVAMLESADSNAWSRSIILNGEPVSLFEWVYTMALEDADTLRTIGVEFYERRAAFGIRD